VADQIASVIALDDCCGEGGGGVDCCDSTTAPEVAPIVGVNKPLIIWASQ